MAENEMSDAKQRVLDVAEALFMRRGYNAVTLRDIAHELTMRQASLYYHFPEGKEQIYVAVAERAFERHRIGLEEAIDAAGADLTTQLRAVAAWFEAQPRMNLSSIMHSDLPALSEESAVNLGRVAYFSLFEPLQKAFMASHLRGETRAVNPTVLAGMVLAVIDGMAFSGRRPDSPSNDEMMDNVISVMLDGLRTPDVAPDAIGLDKAAAGHEIGASQRAGT